MIPLAGLLSSFFLSLVVYPFWIRFIKKFSLSSRGHVDHIIDQETKLTKEKTPAFGGIPFVMIPFLLAPLFYQTLPYEYYQLLTLAGAFFAVGLADDLYKIFSLSKGISARAKFGGQLFGSALFIALISLAKGSYLLEVPFIASLSFPAFSLGGVVLILFLAFILVGTSNAVNLADGMDGLAGSLSLITLFFLGLAGLIRGEIFLTFMICLLFGSILGFTFFNKKPAQIFMGDVGSLPLGGLIAAFAIYLNQEILLVFYGGIFVVEVLSVILQVYYYKRTKTRIFHCAPLHHHYQFKGWSENKIVYRFALAQTLCAFFGILIYFLARTYA